MSPAVVPPVRDTSIVFCAIPLAALAIGNRAEASTSGLSTQDIQGPPPIMRPLESSPSTPLASLAFSFTQSPQGQAQALAESKPQAAPPPATASKAAPVPAATTGVTKSLPVTSIPPAPSVDGQNSNVSSEQGRALVDTKTSAILLAITLTAAAFTIGKRLFVEIRNVVNDFKNWLLGRSTLSGSIDVIDFEKKDGHTYMEITSFARINIRMLLEHAQAAKHFQRAASLCTPEQPFVSLNYAAAAKGFTWQTLRAFMGVRLTNDEMRKRFDREFREVYSARFSQEIKRRLAGYSDDREAHVLIPIVDRWKDSATGRFGRRIKVERAELCFLVLRQSDFTNYFSDPKNAAKLIPNQRRYSRRISILVDAWKRDQAYKSTRLAAGAGDVKLPEEHPDYPFRRAAALSLWPLIKVLQKSPRASRRDTSTEGDSTLN